MDFHRLAKDVAAASAEARRLAADRFSRFGLYGLSQAGWVIPVAAKDAKAEFMVINSSGVFSPVEEDSEEVFFELRTKGYGADVLAKARTVTDATGEVRASLYRNGFEQLAKVKQLYGKEPWFGEIQGEFSGRILRTDEAELRKLAGHNPLGIPWRHDSVAVLQGLSLPTLWTRAEKDRASPMGLTVERLRELRKEGKPIELVIIPDTDHGNMEFTEAPNGTRSFTRFAEGYYRLLFDWIKQRRNPPYGKAKFENSR
jgi:pimeloyl-ACP methyl ester carboxylesterase